MTRKKVNLTYIANDSKRRATFKKRNNGLIKKVDEITTLCGIEACAIIYNPNNPQPEVWPSPLGVQRVIYKFKSMPISEQNKKMMNQESFLRQRILKAQEQLKKQRNDNRNNELSNLMFQLLRVREILDNVNMIDLNDLLWIIDQNLNDINRKINLNQAPKAVSLVADRATTMNGEQTRLDHVQRKETNKHVVQNHNWFMDFINGHGDEMLFRDANPQNGFPFNPRP